MIGDVGVGDVVVVSKSKIMDEGEELFDEVGEGHAWVVVNEGHSNEKRSLYVHHDAIYQSYTSQNRSFFVIYRNIYRLLRRL